MSNNSPSTGLRRRAPPLLLKITRSMATLTQRDSHYGMVVRAAVLAGTPRLSSPWILCPAPSVADLWVTGGQTQIDRTAGVEISHPDTECPSDLTVK